MKHDFTLTLSPVNQKRGFVYLLFELLLLPGLLFSLGRAVGITSEATVNIIYHLINFAVCLILFHTMLHRSVHNALAHPVRILAVAVTGFIVFQLAGSLIGALLLYLYPDFSNVNDAAVASMVYEAPIPMLIGIGFLVPVAEECLFRGLLFAPVFHRSPPWAFALSVLVFAGIHVVGYIGLFPARILLLCFIQYLPAGLVLCWAMKATDSLIAPILIHSAINLFSLFHLR